MVFTWDFKGLPYYDFGDHVQYVLSWQLDPSGKLMLPRSGIDPRPFQFRFGNQPKHGARIRLPLRQFLEWLAQRVQVPLQYMDRPRSKPIHAADPQKLTMIQCQAKVVDLCDASCSTCWQLVVSDMQVLSWHVPTIRAGAKAAVLRRRAACTAAH